MLPAGSWKRVALSAETVTYVFLAGVTSEQGLGWIKQSIQQRLQEVAEA